ncbi:hypothetical protein WA556_003551 [Blastocystis sp. ATCC 50177/Nand II]
MDDSLLGDFNPEEAFESSQEPLFLPSHRASSLSLEPDVFGASHTLGSTADYPHSFRTYHYMPMNHLGYDHSMDLQGDLFDDRFSTPSFHPPRSFSDVDMTTLPDSFDLPKPPRMGPGGLDSARPRLLKHNSVSSIRSSHDDVFALPPAPSPAHGAQVVKGSFHAAAVADSPSSTSPVAPPAVPAATPAAPVASVVAAPVPPAAPLLPVSRSSEGHHKERGGKKSAAGKMESSEAKKLGEFGSYRGHVVEMVCTQNGSKSLQTFLNSAMSESVRVTVIDEIVKEVAPTGPKIICDTFGNYFYQLLFKKANAQQKQELLRSLLWPKGAEGGSTIFEISVNKTGTFAFQNIIDFMAGDRALGELIVRALERSATSEGVMNVILRLIRENKGTHIIQRIMKTFPSDQWESVYAVLLANCHAIAMDRNGSMVLRLCYDLVAVDKKAAIARDIIAHAHDLAVDPVGNYVVQHVLSVPEDATEAEAAIYRGFIEGVLGQLAGHYVELSKQKYSSNVVEKSIVNSKLLGSPSIFEELLEPGAIVQLLENHFGTYVLQKTLQTMSREEVKRVDAEVRGNRVAMGSHGGNLLNKWKQIVSKAI